MEADVIVEKPKNVTAVVSLPPTRRRCLHLCLYLVCLFHCHQHLAKTTEWIPTELAGRVGHGRVQASPGTGAEPQFFLNAFFNIVTWAVFSTFLLTFQGIVHESFLSGAF